MAERLAGNDRGNEMARPKKDRSREDRIAMEIVVDAYDEDERALGWYYFLSATSATSSDGYSLSRTRTKA